MRAFWSHSYVAWALGDLPGSWVCIVMLVFSFMGRGAAEPGRGMPMAGDRHASVYRRAGPEPFKVLARCNGREGACVVQMWESEREVPEFRITGVGPDF